MLEIKINLQLLNASRPVDEPTRHEIQGFIFSILDSETASVIHDSKSMKDYVFTKIQSNGKKYIKSNYVHFKHPFVHFCFSSLNDEIIDSFINNIDYKRIYQIGKLFVKVISIDTIEPDIKGDFFKIATIEPILLKNVKKRISCSDKEDFKKALSVNISKRLNKPFDINNIEILRGKQKYEKYMANISHICSNCEILIHCSSTDIKKLYYGGIGNLTSSGFGKIKIIESCYEN